MGGSLWLTLWHGVEKEIRACTTFSRNLIPWSCSFAEVGGLYLLDSTTNGQPIGPPQGAVGAKTCKQLYKRCTRRLPPQELLRADVHMKTGKGKVHFTIRSLFPDELCSHPIPGHN